MLNGKIFNSKYTNMQIPLVYKKCFIKSKFLMIIFVDIYLTPYITSSCSSYTSKVKKFALKLPKVMCLPMVKLLTSHNPLDKKFWYIFI